MLSPWKILSVCFLAAFFTRDAVSQLYEGEACVDDSGQKGVCKLLNNCDEVIRGLDTGIKPTICSFQQQLVIVCCSMEKSAQLNSKSGQKCKEYAKLVLQEDKPVTLKEDGEEHLNPPSIIGGNAAQPMEFPHMAAVGFGEENNIFWWCGGSLISERFVLTAAHCLASKSKGLARWVRLGDLNLVKTNDEVQTQQFAIKHLFRHPGYEPPARYNDIGLLELDHDVTFTPFVKPACLHTQETLPSMMPEAIGWGLTEWGTSRTSDDLLKVGLKYIAMEFCNSTYAPLEGGRKLNRGIDEDTMLCVGDLGGGKDTCQGDSGGPLHVHPETPPELFKIIGITSFGSACGSKNSPAIYTKVSYFVPWIESIVWP